MQQGSDLWQYFAVIIIVAGAGYYLLKKFILPQKAGNSKGCSNCK